MNFTKTLVAAALLAGAASANAANLVVADRTFINGENEIFLQIYNPDFVNQDGSLGATYNTGLGISFNQFKTDLGFTFADDGSFQGGFSEFNSAGFVQAIGSGINVGLDPLFQTITNTGSNIIYQLNAGNDASNVNGDINILVSGAGVVEQNSDVSAGFGDRAASITIRGQDIAREQRRLGNVASYIIANEPFNPLNPQGQYITPGFGSPANTFGASPNLQGAVALGLDAKLFYTTSQFVRDEFGNILGFSTTNDTIFDVGFINLSTEGLLTFTPPGVSEVPLPAAVWMFGAGLMGVLRLTRRKAA